MKKFLFDLFPLILFFAVFNFAGDYPEQAGAIAAKLNYEALDPKQLPILLATAVTILATMMQIAWVWFRHGKVDTMLWVSLGLISVLGGATLLLQDPTFIIWKPTALYWFIAIALTVSHLLFKKNLIRSMLQAQMELPEAIWTKMNYSWVGFFSILGIVNLYVAYNYTLSFWVKFKVFGTTGIMFTFMLVQLLLVSKHVIQKENP